METMMNLRVNSTISFPGRGSDENALGLKRSTFGPKDCSSLLLVQSSWDRLTVHHQKGASPVLAFAESDSGRQGTKVKLPKVNKSSGKSRSCEKDHKPPNSKSLRITDDGRLRRRKSEAEMDASSSQAGSSDAKEANRKPGKGSAWAGAAGARQPLSRDEEFTLSADVQDMLYLEHQKDEMGTNLGREPTVDEWAAHSGTSVSKLYARIGKGRAAKRRMISANLPLVESIAEGFRGRQLSHRELCQEGVLGLSRGIEKFDASRKTKFSTYSFLWIWQKMSSGVKKFRNVLRISRTVYETASRLLKHKEEYSVMHGRQPTLEELADLSQVDKHTIRNVVRLVRPIKSMDQVLFAPDSDSEIQVEDQTLGHRPWNHVVNSGLRTEVALALQSLAPREQRILEMRYGLCGELPKRRAQVALALNLSHESVRLIERRALDKLRHVAKEEGLQDYLSQGLWSQ